MLTDERGPLLLDDDDADATEDSPDLETADRGCAMPPRAGTARECPDDSDEHSLCVRIGSGRLQVLHSDGSAIRLFTQHFYGVRCDTMSTCGEHLATAIVDLNVEAEAVY